MYTNGHISPLTRIHRETFRCVRSGSGESAANSPLAATTASSWTSKRSVDVRVALAVQTDMARRAMKAHAAAIIGSLCSDSLQARSCDQLDRSGC